MSTFTTTVRLLTLLRSNMLASDLKNLVKNHNLRVAGQTKAAYIRALQVFSSDKSTWHKYLQIICRLADAISDLWVPVECVMFREDLIKVQEILHRLLNLRNNRSDKN